MRFYHALRQLTLPILLSALALYLLHSPDAPDHLRQSYWVNAPGYFTALTLSSWAVLFPLRVRLRRRRAYRH